MKSHASSIALREAIIELANIDPVAYERVDELGRSYGFTKVIPVFISIKRLYQQLSKCDLDEVPDAVVDQMISLVKSTNDLLRRVQAFSPTAVESSPAEFNNKLPAKVHEDLIQEIETHHLNLFGQLTPRLAYHLAIAANQEELRENVNDIIKGLSEHQRILAEQYKEKLVGIETALEKVQQTAQKVGVAAHAEHFKSESESHEREAKAWLIYTIILACLTFLLGIASLIAGILWLSSLSPTQSVNLAIAKIVIFSLLFSGIVWTGRVYRAHKHNAVVNKHRQNALSTFETFAIAAGEDQQIKNAVLLQATQCIFSPQQTGYVTQEADTAGYPQILEIVRGIASPQGKN